VAVRKGRTFDPEAGAWGFRDFPHSAAAKENRNDSRRTLLTALCSLLIVARFFIRIRRLEVVGSALLKRSGKERNVESIERLERSGIKLASGHPEVD
jgi:hypothetical protein